MSQGRLGLGAFKRQEVCFIADIVPYSFSPPPPSILLPPPSPFSITWCILNTALFYYFIRLAGEEKGGREEIWPWQLGGWLFKRGGDGKRCWRQVNSGGIFWPSKAKFEGRNWSPRRRKKVTKVSIFAPTTLFTASARRIHFSPTIFLIPAKRGEREERRDLASLVGQVR